MARQGGGPDAQFAADRDVFHSLLQNHEAIRREVKNTENGVETLTESDKPEIAAKIQEHVAAMAKRVEQRRPIHMRDPLFAEVFRHADKIHLKYEKTAKGVRVVETSDDPYVVKLIQAHGGVVSLFVKNGFAEARKNHEVPGAKGGVATAADAARQLAPSVVPGRDARWQPRPVSSAAGQCPCPAPPLCPAGKNCPLATACPAGKDCPHAKACPAGKDCPHAKSCPAGQDCPQASSVPLASLALAARPLGLVRQAVGTRPATSDGIQEARAQMTSRRFRVSDLLWVPPNVAEPQSIRTGVRPLHTAGLAAGLARTGWQNVRWRRSRRRTAGTSRRSPHRWA